MWKLPHPVPSPCCGPGDTLGCVPQHSLLVTCGRRAPGVWLVCPEMGWKNGADVAG